MNCLSVLILFFCNKFTIPLSDPLQRDKILLCFTKEANWAEHNISYDALWLVDTRCDTVFNLKFCN